MSHACFPEKSRWRNFRRMNGIGFVRLLHNSVLLAKQKKVSPPVNGGKQRLTKNRLSSLRNACASARSCVVVHKGENCGGWMRPQAPQHEAMCYRRTLAAHKMARLYFLSRHLLLLRLHGDVTFADEIFQPAGQRASLQIVRQTAELRQQFVFTDASGFA